MKRPWKPDAIRGSLQTRGDDYRAYLYGAAMWYYRHDLPRKGNFYRDVHSCLVYARKAWLDKRAWQQTLADHRSAYREAI